MEDLRPGMNVVYDDDGSLIAGVVGVSDGWLELGTIVFRDEFEGVFWTNEPEYSEVLCVEGDVARTIYQPTSGLFVPPGSVLVYVGEDEEYPVLALTPDGGYVMLSLENVRNIRYQMVYKSSKG